MLLKLEIFYVVFLLTILAVPFLNAAPTNSLEELTVKQVTGRVSLILIVAKGFLEVFSDLPEKIPQVFRAVLKDPQVLAIKSTEMESHLRDLKNCIRKTNELDESSEKEAAFEVMTECMNTLSKFDGDEQKLSPDAALIEKSLDENGLIEIENIIENNFKLFLKKFKRQADEYLDSLNENEKNNEKEFIEWLHKLKPQQDFKMQIEMFSELLKGN